MLETKKTSTNQFETVVTNLEGLETYKFTIPTYQRPYVWGDEQLKKLVTDCWNAYQLDQNRPYYVGTVLVKMTDVHTAELIDGQQRFTTLWLLAYVFQELNIQTDLMSFLCFDTGLRLGFEIRTEVSSYLNDLLLKQNGRATLADESEVLQHAYLRHIAKARTYILNMLKQLEPSFESSLKAKDGLGDFGDYLYRQVRFILNTAPTGTDLNKLFATMNSSGKQLEHTDILKSQLLSKVNNKLMYSRIWEACENMDSWFEKNVFESFPKTNREHVDLSNYNEFDSEKFKFETFDEQSAEKMADTAWMLTTENLKESLDTIDIEQRDNEKDGDDSKDSEVLYCRSIINLPQLLIHTYRIHLHRTSSRDFDKTFDVKNLLDIFEPLIAATEDEIEDFFRLLWEVRYHFDKYVVKWVDDNQDGEETLELMSISRKKQDDKYYYSRASIPQSSSMMLQSAMYFTGDYLRQYWLTVFLNDLISYDTGKTVSSDEVLELLEDLDRHIMMRNRSISEKQLTFDILNNWRFEELNYDLGAYLNEALGTSFRHAWFQRLEYLLWKKYVSSGSIPKAIENKLPNFRITSKNSVEHVSPQKVDSTSTDLQWDKNDNDSFGNLILLSVVQNSEYSNKPYQVKRQEFYSKRRLASLKAVEIFERDEWTPSHCQEHLNQMSDLLLARYSPSQS